MTDSIGTQLQKARQAQHLSLEQAAQTTHIKLHYLKALEADNFEALPSKVQQRGFLRSYAGLLNLPVENLLAQLDGGIPPSPADPVAVQAGDTSGRQPAGDPTPDQQILRPTGSIPASSQTIPDRAPNPILQEVGSLLKEQRELLDLSLDDVEAQTHLRMRYLSALEDGRLENLPSPVQGRGMLNNYVEFLGMEPEPVLLRYAEGLQADLKSKQEKLRQSTAQSKGRQGKSGGGVIESLPSPFRRFFSSDFWIGGIVAVFLVGFVIWASLRIAQFRTGVEPTATAPSVADVLAPDTPTPSPSPTIESTPEMTSEGEATLEATPTLALAVVETTPTDVPTPDFQAAESGNIQLYLVARQRAWTRVIVDGTVELEGRIVPGNAYLFTGDDRIELLTGNGAALQAFLNRQDLGPLGITGQIVQRVFTLTGMHTPTPAVPPTPTSTPTPEMTETPIGTGSPQAGTETPDASTPTSTEIAP